MGKRKQVKKTASLGLKIFPELKARLEARAKKLERSKNWLASKYIEEGLERDEKRPKSNAG